MKRVLLAILLGSTLLVGAGALGAHLLGTRQVPYLSDGASLDRPESEVGTRSIAWSTPELVSIEGVTDAYGLDVSDDGTRVVFVRGREGDNAELWIAQRGDGAHWTNPSPLVSLNSARDDLDPAFTPAGDLLFASDRADGIGGYDVYLAEREGSGWSAPRLLGGGISGPLDERGPTALRDGEIVFSSNRPRPEEEFDRDADGHPTRVRAPMFEREHDLYRGVIGLGDSQTQAGALVASLLNEVSSTLSDRDPEVGLAGDFVYFVRQTEQGSVLHRARVFADAFGTTEQVEVEARVAVSPSVSERGFTLWYGSRGEEGPSLYRVEAREVFRRMVASPVQFDLLSWLRENWRLLAALGILLTILALALLLLLDTKNRSRWATLSLMARCVLVSAFVHILLAALFTAWQVKSSFEGLSSESGSRQVALTGGASRSAAQQLRRAAAVTEIESAAASVRSQQLQVRAAVEPGRAVEAKLQSRPQATRELVPSASSDAPQLRTVESRDQRALEAQDIERMPVSDAAEFNEAVPVPSVKQASGERSEPVDPLVERAGGGLASAQISVSGDVPVGAMPVAESRSVSGGVEPSRDLRPELSRRESGLPSAILRGGEAFPSPQDAAMFDIGLPVVPETAIASEDAAGTEELAGVRVGSVSAPARAAPHSSEVALRSTGSVGLSPVPLAASTLPDLAARGGSRLEDSADLGALGAFEDLDLAVPSELAFEVLLRGRVLHAETGEPVKGATVRLDRLGQEPLATLSGERGSFSILPGELPEFFAVSAVAEGFEPGAVDMSSAAVDAGAVAEILLVPERRTLIALEQTPRVHHLGNDRFTGRVNSQFQRESEGVDWHRGFEIDPEIFEQGIAAAWVRVLVKGAQTENPVRVNGRMLSQSITGSPRDGSYEEIVLQLDPSVLQPQANTLHIRAVNAPGTDIDDFEFVNVRIELELSSDGTVSL